MKDSIRLKLETVSDRFEEIAGLLADPDVIGDQNQFRELSKEYARVEPVVQSFQRYEGILQDIAAAEEMVNDADADVREMGQEELTALQERREQMLLDLQKALIPPDPYDDSNVFLEVRAGTGGDEAAIFAGDLFSMYSRYASVKGWKVEVESESEADMGGYKEIVASVSGAGVYGHWDYSRPQSYHCNDDHHFYAQRPFPFPLPHNPDPYHSYYPHPHYNAFHEDSPSHNFTRSKYQYRDRPHER